ncbi:cell division protein SepF [Blastococcus litoris]|uniref:cell division protein SepF n=1 Tax=Blastococcus litoris TaxID=2171622 RepID=UPI002402D5B0|nr:cell division protein SepF [Blastococcus litoris]
MGIYLGLVEDDDARAYGRYDARQSEHTDHDRRYGGRYADDRYDDRYDDEYAGGYADEDLDDEPPAAREPEALPARRERAARPIGLAPAGAGPSRVSAMGGSAGGSAMGSGPVGATAAKLVVREPVAVVAEPAPAPAPQPYRITTLHPRTYNEARVIGERFRDGMPVIMNLTEMDDSDAKRLVDFAAGLSFGLRGSIERVTAKVFLLSPQNVDVTAEDKARIREGGFFNQS